MNTVKAKFDGYEVSEAAFAIVEFANAVNFVFNQWMPSCGEAW